jgi:hypothetical protein
MDTIYTTNGQRQTAKLNYGKSTMWEKKPRTTPREASRLFVGLEQVTRHKTLQAV